MNTLDEVLSADRAVLAARWEALFHRPPPANVQVAMIRRVIAWHVQAKASEWKGAKGEARLDRALRPANGSSTPSLNPGTRLLREWRGGTHEVQVLDKGFEYQGQTFKSLSAISRTITGTPWSGPAFFGIRP